MGIKKILLSVMLVSTITLNVSFAQAASNEYQADIEKNIDSFVRNAYEPFYNINSTNLSTTDYSIDNNVLTARVNINLNKTLKAQSVDEIPYVKGMKQELGSLKKYRDLKASNAEQLLNAKVEDLKEYIGVEQEQNDSFRITADIVNGAVDFNNAKLEYLDYLDWVPAYAFIPNTETTMIQKGEKDLLTSATENFNAEQLAPTQSLAAAIKYDRIAARDYANKWTSNNPPGGQDATKYNKDYTYYDSDCANYVSQSIFAGGIPTDSTWKPKAIAWINTGRDRNDGLKQYMVDTKGYFSKSTKSGVSAGGFISALGYSHVMFVVANDGVTMLFSAHTTDRKQASFAGFKDSEYEYYYINSAYQ